MPNTKIRGAIAKRRCRTTCNEAVLDHPLTSQKIPQRWLETLAHHQGRDEGCAAILTALAAWLRHVRGDNGAVDDPLAADLKKMWATSGEADKVPAMFGDGGPLKSTWRPTAVDRRCIVAALRAESPR